jgi:uncharacterized protein (DUF302 family)
MHTEKIVLEYKSRFDFSGTVDTLVSEAEKNMWKVPFIHDLQASIAKSGKSVRPVKIIEICKPEYSGQLLELNDERIMSVLMPCRISVYEKNDGAVYVGLLNMEAMSAGLQNNIATVIKTANDDMLKVTRAVSTDC